MPPVPPPRIRVTPARPAPPPRQSPTLGAPVARAPPPRAATPPPRPMNAPLSRPAPPPPPPPAAPAAIAFAALGALFLAGAIARLALASSPWGALAQAMPLLGLGAAPLFLFALAVPRGRGPIGPPIDAALVALGALLVFVAHEVEHGLAPIGAGLWALGMTSHVLLRVRDRPLGVSRAIGARALHLGSLAYGLAAAAAVPMAYTGGVTITAAFHLLLPGYATLGLLAWAAERERFPRAVATIVAGLGLLGPALLALGNSGGATALLAGAGVEAPALALGAIGLLAVAAAAPRPAGSPALLGAAAAIAAGVVLGVLFALSPATRVLAPVHGLLNAVGFVGLGLLGLATAALLPPREDAPARARLADLAGLVGLATVLGAAGLVAAGSFEPARTLLLAAAVAPLLVVAALAPGMRQPRAEAVPKRTAFRAPSAAAAPPRTTIRPVSSASPPPGPRPSAPARWGRGP